MKRSERGRNEIVPLLDAIGGRGVYLVTSFSTTREGEEIASIVEPYA